MFQKRGEGLKAKFKTTAFTIDYHSALKKEGNPVMCHNMVHLEETVLVK